MTDTRSAWNEAGERLSGLGHRLKEHYEQQHAAEAEKARPEAEETRAEAEKTRAEASDAVKRLGEAVHDAFDAMGAAARDDAVRQDVKGVGRSLADALSVTFAEVSEELRKAFGRADEPAQAEDGEPAAHAEDAPESAQASAQEAPSKPQGEPPSEPPKVEPWGTP